MSAAKKARRDDVEDVGDKLYQRFQQSGLTFNNVVVEAGLSDEGEGVLFIAGLEIAFSVFSTPDSFGCVNYFKKQMTEYGMSPLDAHKLFLWMKKFHVKFVETNKTTVSEEKKDP